MAFWKIDGFDVMPRMPLLDPGLELAAGDPAAAQVVEPGALALLLVELLETGHRGFLRLRRAGRGPSRPRRSGVKPRRSMATFAGGRGPEAVDGRRGRVDPALPAERGRRLDGERRHAGGEHRPPVGLVLRGEQLPARHRHDAGSGRPRRPGARRRRRRATPRCRCRPARRRDRRPDRRGRRRPWPGASPPVPSSTGRSWRVRISATGPSRSTATRHACGGLVGVGRADHAQAGDGPQRGEVLDRLVGRAVLAERRRSRGSTSR